ncbi:MAG: hypothetical protein U1F76_15160 [Candidatus Competibacteraceae bacterium]
MKRRNRPTPTKAELIQIFWSAPDDAFLDRRTVAAGLGLSATTLEIYAVKGCGPAYIKRGQNVLYTKRDALEWHHSKSRRVNSTAELQRGAA